MAKVCNYKKQSILIVFISLLISLSLYIYVHMCKTEHLRSLRLNSSKEKQRTGSDHIKPLNIITLKLKEHANTSYPQKPLEEKVNSGSSSTTCSYIGVKYFRSRLGNLMFQYASTLGIARTNTLCILMPKSVPRKTIQFRSYFHLSATPTDTGLPENSQKTVGEKRCCIFHKQYMQLNSTSNYTISGALQSYKYFISIQNEIYREFQFTKSIDSAARIFLGKAISNFNTTLVGIHVRRGDFLVKSNQNKGFVVAPMSYINNAMKYFIDKFNNVHFIVCSDDINWCKENIKSTRVSFSQDNTPIVDMAILSNCDHVVMTTGTFGWWAGFLSRGTVVYYADWPKKGSELYAEVNRNDHFMPHWIPMR